MLTVSLDESNIRFDRHEQDPADNVGTSYIFQISAVLQPET